MNRWMIVGLLAFSAAASAQDGDSAADTAPALGGETRTWLELQKDPAAQVPEVRPVPGEVSEQVYQRYINSFKHPIPDQFERESFLGGGGGGGR